MKLSLCVNNRLSTKTCVVVQVNIQLFLSSHLIKVGCRLLDLSIFTTERILL